MDQKKGVSALRGVEVSGDPTSALALYAALWRKYEKDDYVARLCASHRCVRMQPFDVPGFTPHFRLFGLVTAGRDRGSLDFEIAALGEHIRFYLDLMRELNPAHFPSATPPIHTSPPHIT